VLIHDGKIKASEIRTAIKRRERLLKELRGQLTVLGEGYPGRLKIGPPTLRIVPNPPPTGRRRKRRQPVSPARKAAMKAQGRYLAAVRPLSKANRAKVRAIREKSGVTKAIAAAKRMAK
jgi:hypothetical protein